MISTAKLDDALTEVIRNKYLVDAGYISLNFATF